MTFDEHPDLAEHPARVLPRTGERRPADGPQTDSPFGRLFETSGPASLIEVQGERWSGKSTLLTALSREAADRGWTVASGSGAAPSLRGVPFGLLVEALDGVLCAHGEPVVQDGWPEAQKTLLSEAFPTLARALPHGTRGDPVGRYQTFRAVRDLLDSLGSAGGLLLVLDDVHWADRASVELLAYLLVNPPSGAVAIAIAHRPRQADLTLQALLNQGALEGRVQRLNPPRLSDEAALALLPGDISRVQSERMLSASGHNPGLLKAFAATRSVTGGPDHAPLTLPLDVLTACLRDFQALSELGQLVVRAASVLGEVFDPDLLKDVAQIDDEQQRTSIDELMREDLLRTDRFSRRLRFSNPLLRAAAYQSAGPGWRLGAHDRAVGRLARRGSGPVELAWHLGHSAVMGDEDGVRVLGEAAAEHLWFDPGQAATWASTALDLCERSDDTGHERLLLARALILCGRLHDGLAAVDTVPGPVVASCGARAEVARLRDTALRFLGCHEEARAQLAAALEGPGPLCAEHRALLLGTRLSGALSAGWPRPGGEPAELLGAADALTGAARGWVHALAATAAAADGSAERAATLAQAAARMLDEADDDAVVRHLDGLLHLARTESLIGRAGAARVHRERGMRIAESRRLALFVARFAREIAVSRGRDGDLSDAVRHAAAAEWAAATTDSGPLLEDARALRARLGSAPEAAAVPAVRIGSSAADDGPAEATGAAQAAAVRSELARLSKRELEIAVLVSSGRTNQQIARALAVSHKTVETHLGRIFKKLIVSSRAEVAAMVGRSNGSRQRFTAERTAAPALQAG